MSNMMKELDDIPGSEWEFDTGQQVAWRDPDKGVSSGIYTIIERIEWGPIGSSTYLLSNGRFNVEAYERDLT